MGPTDTRVSKRIAVVERRRGAVFLPQGPIVGDRLVAIGYNGELLVALERIDLSVVLRTKVPGVAPLEWFGEDELLVGGEATVGIFSVKRRKFNWRQERALPLGGQSWGDHILTWSTPHRVDLRQRRSALVKRSVDIPAPDVGFATLCGDLIICTSEGTDDPVRAVDLRDGRIAWSRDLIAEMRSRSGSANSAVSFVPGSTSRIVIAAVGQATFGCSLDDGRVLWKADVYVPYYWPLVDQGLIPILDWKRFVVIDEATGRLLCDRTHPQLQEMYHAKRGARLGDLVIFVSESGHVAAFDIMTGDLAFLEHHPGVAFWGTAIADGRLLVSATDGHLWVYEGLSSPRPGGNGAAARVH